MFTILELDDGSGNLICELLKPDRDILAGVQVRDGNWGIDPTGQPYFNPRGVTSADIATLTIDSTGSVALTR